MQSAPELLVTKEPVVGSSYHTAVIHFYRGEMTRMMVWRRRLDTTTHWAIILSTALTTFTLGSDSVPHYVMLLAVGFDMLFMALEGRRYRHLHHSKWRLNILEHNYFAPLFSNGGPVPEPDWRSQLEVDLRHRHFTLTLWMASRLRFRMNYLMITGFVGAVWTAKLFIHPVRPVSFADFWSRLAIPGLMPSWLVAAAATVFVFGAVIVVALTPSEEELEAWSIREHSRIAAAQGSSKPVGPAAPQA